jgi:hypothetical protein
MDEAGIGAGAAIPQKSERPTGRTGWAIECVRDVKHVGMHVAGVVVANGNETGFGSVLEGPAADHSPVTRGADANGLRGLVPHSAEAGEATGRSEELL